MIFFALKNRPLAFLQIFFRSNNFKSPKSLMKITYNIQDSLNFTLETSTTPRLTPFSNVKRHLNIAIIVPKL